MSPAAPRETAGERISRILAELLWIAERDGPTLAETAARFDLSEETLLADLELASMIGADSEDYADMPVEMYVEDERVFVHLLGFERPLRLTPAEALGLVAAGSAVLGAEHHQTPLRSALDKVAGVLGIEVGDQIEVDLGVGDPAVFEALSTAVEQRRLVRLTHLNLASDSRTERDVEPWQLFRERGAWYLAAHCRRAGAPRTFRVDRIVAAGLTDETIVAPDPLPEASALSTPVDAPRVVLELAPEARWVWESHPIETSETRSDGWTRVTMLVVSPLWLERLLLRLGPHARLVSLDAPLGPENPAQAAARRALARYGIGDGDR